MKWIPLLFLAANLHAVDLCCHLYDATNQTYSVWTGELQQGHLYGWAWGENISPKPHPYDPPPIQIGPPPACFCGSITFDLSRSRKFVRFVDFGTNLPYATAKSFGGSQFVFRADTNSPPRFRVKEDKKTGTVSIDGPVLSVPTVATIPPPPPLPTAPKKLLRVQPFATTKGATELMRRSK